VIAKRKIHYIEAQDKDYLKKIKLSHSQDRFLWGTYGVVCNKNMIDGGMMVPDISLFTLQLPLSVSQPTPDQGTSRA
jgi:hypothetical protein